MSTNAKPRTTNRTHTGARKERRDWKPAFLAALETEGTVCQACAVVNVSRSTAYLARQQDEEFALSWADVESKVTDALERKAVALALDGDTRMLEFLLKSRRPEKYRENVKVEHTGRIGTDLDTLSNEQLAELADGLSARRG